MPRYRNSNSESTYGNNWYNRNYNSEGNYFNRDPLNNVKVPVWNSEDFETALSIELSKELAKKGITRKQLNNALKQVNPKGKGVALSFFNHVVQGNLRDVKQFIDAGQDLGQRARDGTGCLHYALRSKKPLLMLKLLLDGGADVNMFNNKSRSPLHTAILNLNGKCSQKDYEIIHYLLDRGALLYPIYFDLSVLDEANNQMNRLSKKLFGHELPYYHYNQTDALLQYGSKALDDLKRMETIMDRLYEEDSEHIRLLKFKTMMSDEVITLQMDDRAPLRIVRDYARFWILKQGFDGKADLLLPGTKGQPPKPIDLDQTVESAKITEDTPLFIVPKLQTQTEVYNYYGGKRQTRRKRRD